MRSGVYKHYKGQLYQVLFVAQHTERPDEQLVIYVPLEGAHLPGLRIRARPMHGIKGWKTLEIIEGKEKPRFVIVEAD